MKIHAEADVAYDFPALTDVILSVHAACSPDQSVISEQFEIFPPVSHSLDGPDDRGERRIRARVEGAVRFNYRCEVENFDRRPLPSAAIQHLWSELPQSVLQYLTPSRYCPSDKFLRFASREFGGTSEGGARVHAILDWIHANLDYVPGVSVAETTAERTFIDRAGVCRDFSHLGITFCRALGMPARAVSAYSLGLEPEDFHAVFEVYLDHDWWMLDATRLSPREGLVRIGTGRDAGDIAFLTTSGPCAYASQSVVVRSAQDG